MAKQDCVYIIECRDGSFYTGWTNDIDSRLEAHNHGTGAKYTRGRLPVKLVYIEYVEDKSAGLKREIAIKKLSKAQKKALIVSSGSRK